MNNKITFIAQAKLPDERTAEGIAKKTGIVLPSSHLAIFVASLAPLDKPNNNGVGLSEEASKKFLKTIHQAQANFSHLGAWYVCGSIIDEWIDEDTKETKVAFTFYKELYPEEFAHALVAQHEGTLGVSFELLSDVSSATEHGNGTITLNEFEYTGMGVLGVIDNKKPAYSKGLVHSFAENLKNRVTNSKHKELLFAEEIVNQCDKVLADYDTQVLPSPDEIVIYIVTTLEDGHFHMAEVDYDGNGQTIATHGKDEMFHVHQIMSFQIQESDGHVHKIMNEFMAELKEYIAKKKQSKKRKSKKKWNYSEVEENLNEEKIMTDEQKKKVAELRAELGTYIPADTKDEVLLDEVKVAEFRKTKTDADEVVVEAAIPPEVTKRIKELVDKGATPKDATKQAWDEYKKKNAEDQSKVEACGGDLIRIQELEAKIKELTNTIDAQKAELETVKAENTSYKAAEEVKLAEEKAAVEAEKKANIDAIKAELKDNEFAAKFSDEDYLDSDKVTVAKERKELATIKANGGKVTAQVKPELPTGVIAEVKPASDVKSLLNKMLKKEAN